MDGRKCKEEDKGVGEVELVDGEREKQEKNMQEEEWLATSGTAQVSLCKCMKV